LPILFHSGYLTVDKIKLTDIECLKTEDLPLVRSYTFRYPNYEVSTSYKSDVCSVLFNTEPNALMTDGAGLLNALLGKDVRTIETIFGKLFTRIISHQRPKDEKTFRAFVRLVMAAAGLKVRGEPSGAKMRPDCLVE
jgi:hypothetical protein